VQRVQYRKLTQAGRTGNGANLLATARAPNDSGRSPVACGGLKPDTVTAIVILPPDTISFTFFGTSKGEMFLYALDTADGTQYWGATVGPIITIYPHVVL